MKKFFSDIFLFIIAICLAGFLYPQYTASKTLKFAQISDLHLSHRNAISGNRMHPNSFDLTKDAITQINKIPSLDFVAITGDGIDSPQKELIEEFKEILSTIKYPYYFVFGNHDVNVDFSKEKFIKVFSNNNKNNTFKEPYYSKTIKNDFHLIFLDGAYDTKITSNGHIDDKQLKWFDKELSKNKNKIILIFTHFPIREPFSSHNHKIENDKEVEEILKKYSMPIAIFSGHYHTTKITKEDNIIHISSPSLIMYPNAFRVINIEKNKDNVSFIFDFYETNLKAIQKTSKMLTLSGGLAYGKNEDRVTKVTIKKENKENRNEQQ